MDAALEIAFPLRLDSGYGFYEYACHEGNYALTNILSGARAEEAGSEVNRNCDQIRNS